MTSTEPGENGSQILLHLDRDLCVGAANCVSLMPAVFDQTDDDGRAVLIADSVDASAAEVVDEVIDLCPAAAISAELARPRLAE